MSGLVQRVVAHNPRVGGIVLSQLLPEPDRAVLKVLVQPEVHNMCTGITVPVHVLATKGSVHVKNDVDPILDA